MNNPTFVLSLIYRRSKNEKEFKKIFWEEVITEIVKICEEEYEKANKELKNLKLSGSGFLKKLLEKTYKPIVEAKEQRIKVKQLLTRFKDSPGK